MIPVIVVTGDGGVTQDMPLDHRADREPAADRGLHVLAVTLGPDRGPGDPGDNGE